MATKPITDTGIRGFLKWFKVQQPGIYAKVAPMLPSAVPAAFSGYHQGGWRVAGLSRDQAVEKLNAMQNTALGAVYRGKFANRVGVSGLSDYSSYTSVGGGVSYYSSAPSVGTQYIDATTPTANLPSDAASAPSVDVATAANNGVSPSSVAYAVGDVINTASQAYLSATQAQTQANIINTQLQRAASGLAPLTTSLSSLGIPSVSAGLSTTSGGTLLLFGGGALLLLLLMGKK